MVVKIDPGAQVNTIPLSRYHTLSPNKLTKSRYPKAQSLMPTHHTMISHDGSPKPFLGHFIVEVAHVKEPRMYPIRFYVFEDATHPQILLSYATPEWLGIITFQVPNLAAIHSLDHVAVQTPSCKKKTAKQVTFQDPISMIEGSHTSSNPPDLMPSTYTIRTDPSVPPVQHARQKVPIEYRDWIEKALDDMVLKEVIAPVTKPTTWVSSLTYPHKLDGTLCICLDLRTLIRP